MVDGGESEAGANEATDGQVSVEYAYMYASILVTILTLFFNQLVHWKENFTLTAGFSSSILSLAM